MCPATQINRIVKRIDDIPTIPVISHLIQDLFKDDDTSIKQVEAVVMRDPPLAAKLLKLVNSSFYGLLNKVSSIDHALVILGFKEVRHIVLGFSLQKHFDNPNNSFDPTRFWKHSVVCSQIAKHLGKHFNMVDDGTYLLSGLIHDIGKLVIDQYFPEEFETVLQRISSSNCTFSEAEKEVLGVTHYQIAAKLLQQWHFPRKVTMQIFYHHAPWHDKNFTTGSIIIYLANMMSKLCGYACLPDEKEIQPAEITRSSVMEYINKNGFDMDEESFEILCNQIQEFLAVEKDKVLNIFT